MVLEFNEFPLPGKVTMCRVVSSEIDDPELEKKIVARVACSARRRMDVETITTTNPPIDFFRPRKAPGCHEPAVGNRVLSPSLRAGQGTPAQHFRMTAQEARSTYGPGTEQCTTRCICGSSTNRVPAQPG